MSVRPSSSLGARTAIKQVIYHTEIKVRVGVITDWQLDYFCFKFFSLILIYVQLKSLIVLFSTMNSNAFSLIPQAQREECGTETPQMGLSVTARPTTSNLHYPYMLIPLQSEILLRSQRHTSELN